MTKCQVHKKRKLLVLQIPHVAQWHCLEMPAIFYLQHVPSATAFILSLSGVKENIANVVSVMSYEAAKHFPDSPFAEWYRERAELQD